MGVELTLAQQLRVSAALFRETSLSLDRESALWLVRMIEREEAVSRAEDTVRSVQCVIANLRAEQIAREARRDAALHRTISDCFTVTIAALTLSWLIAWGF